MTPADPDRPATCPSCGAAIRFVRTDHGRTIPLDVAPVPNGTIVLAPVSGHAVFLRKGAAGPPGADRFQRHVASCPSADRVRVKRSRHA